MAPTTRYTYDTVPPLATDYMVEVVRICTSAEQGGQKWAEILLRCGVYFNERSSGTKYSLCVFHQEKTPSLAFYSNGGFICYGCNCSGDTADFIVRQDMVSITELLDLFTVPPEQLPTVLAAVQEYEELVNQNTHVVEHHYTIGEEPF